MNKKTFTTLALMMCYLIITLPIVSALRIDNVAVSNVDRDSATVTFETDGPAVGAVEYGTTLAFGNRQEGPSGTDHRFTLSNLQGASTYFFQARATDDDGSTIDTNGGEYYKIETLSAEDLTPPRIFNISYSNFEQASTRANWKTDEPATSTVWADKGNGFDETSDSNTRTIHQVTFPTTSNTETTVILMSCNQAGFCTNSSPRTFRPGIDQQPPELKANIPKYTQTHRILITGETEPLAEIKILVNGQQVRDALADSEGKFRVPNVPLSKLENRVEVRAKDIAGNTEMAQETVRIDAGPPRLNVFGFSQVSTSPQFQVRGRVNEKSTIHVYTNLQEDSISPARITDLTTTDIRSGSVALQWGASDATDFLEYAIYRDNTLIGTSKLNRFVDNTMPLGEEVGYRVSAIDQSCNEGPRSDTLTIKTASTGTSQPQQQVKLSCGNAVTSFEAEGDFSRALQLQEGENEIIIVAEDGAGNRAQYKNITIYDRTPPRFESLNLAQISPTYTREITIRGKASERVNVLVYIGDEKKPTETEVSNPDGSFKIDVELPIGTLVEEKGSSATAQTAGLGYANSVRVDIVDVAGNTVKSKPEPIVFTSCGFGSYFTIQETKPLPDILTPALIDQGVAEIGFNLNITYTGSVGNFTMRKPSISLRPIAREDQDKFDMNIQIGQPLWDLKRGTARGYVRLIPQRPAFPDSWTRIQRFNNISDSKEGECPLVPPGFGCVRVPLLLEVRGNLQTDRTVQGQQQSDQLGPINDEIMQRTCIDVQVAIDRAIDPDIIHDGFLKTTTEAFDDIIRAIDQVLEPLQTIFQATLYTCLAGFAILFILDIWETYSCDIAPILGAFAEEGEAFDPQIARAGLCNHPDYGYVKDDETAKLNDCKDCQEAAQKNKDTTYYIQWVCDRVYCPSAPSIQKYVKDAANPKTIISRNKEVKEDLEFLHKVKQEANSKNDLATQRQVQSEIDETEVSFGSDCKASGISTNYEGLKLIIDDYKKNKNDKVNADEVYNRENPNCNNLHPSNALCCGYEYDEQYDSACIFFDEMKESKCAQAKLEGKKDDECTGITRIFNSVAGFCEKTGGPSGQMASGDFMMKNKPSLAESNEFFFYIRQGAGDNRKDQSTTREVRGAYQIKSVNPSVNKTSPNFVTITQVNGLQLTGDYSKFFQRENVDCDKEGQQFLSEIKKNEQSLQLTPKSGNEKAAAIAACKQIKSKFPQFNEYVVDPTSSFLRSLQCGCIAGVNSYLQQYRNVLNAVNNCMKSILVTGDGYEGQCDAVLSTYICDVIYEIISCAVTMTDFTVTRKPGKQGGLERIGSIAKTLTDAGAKTQQRVSNRYGKSSIFKALFNEKKLVHAICLFAFTGTWSFDVQALVSGEIPPIPIDSTVLVYPAERRFVSFDTTTQPAGKATFNYHIGMSIAAGADLNQRMYLQCSADFSCKESEGYPGKRCDCFKSGEKKTPVALRQGRLKAGELYTEELYLNIAGGTPQGDIRYDKVVYEYDYRDANDRTQTKREVVDISKVGGDAPAFCQFDLLASIYRCTVDIGLERHARFTSDPIPQYTAEGLPHKQFKLGDAIKFEVPLIQRADDKCNSPPCKDTKFLIWSLKRGSATLSQGTTLLSNDKYANDPTARGRSTATTRPKQITSEEILNFNGEDMRSVEMTLPNIGVDQRMFSGVASSQYQVNPATYQNQFTIEGVPTKEFTIAMFEDEFWQFSGSVSESNFNTGTPVPVKKFKLSDLTANSFTPAGENVRIRVPAQTVQKRIFGEVSRLPNRKAPLLVTIKSTSATNDLCKQYATNPATLTAEFEIRDAEQIGTGVFDISKTVGVDSQGTPQRKTIPIQVICSNTYKASAASVTQSAKTQCEKGTFPATACHCVPDDAAFQKRILENKGPDCGPASSGLTLTGDYCNPQGQCITSGKCETEKEISSGSCHCKPDQASLKQAVDANTPKNCGPKGSESDPVGLNTYCTSQGKCASIPRMRVNLYDIDGNYEREATLQKDGKNLRVDIPQGRQFQVQAIISTGEFSMPGLTFDGPSFGSTKTGLLSFSELDRTFTYTLKDDEGDQYEGTLRIVVLSGTLEPNIGTIKSTVIDEDVGFDQSDTRVNTDQRLVLNDDEKLSKLEIELYGFLTLAEFLGPSGSVLFTKQFTDELPGIGARTWTINNPPNPSDNTSFKIRITDKNNKKVEKDFLVSRI